MGGESEEKQLFNHNLKIERLLADMDCKIDWIEDDMMSLDNGLWLIDTYNKNINVIFLYLHVEICPMKAANIATKLSILADSIGMNVIIEDIYAFEFNQAGDIIGLTYGPDAYETAGRVHYFGIYE